MWYSVSNQKESVCVSMEWMKMLQNCHACPRACGATRLDGKKGFCQAGLLPKVALVSCHQWEEPPISGTRGSGTVFFSHCNLRCVFCQNHIISAEGYGIEITVERLGEIFLEQQEKQYHNVNLVSAAPYLPQTAAALEWAKNHGLTIPVVYNSSGYESVEGLRLLDGLVDVYLPDLKYHSNELAEKYSAAKDYPDAAQKAILEMKRQTGENQYDADGMLQKGMILRHLILPGCYRDSFLVLDWIRENLGEETWISLLRQYTPMYGAANYPEINRKLTTFEYEKVVDHFFEIGLKNGFTQEKQSAQSSYTPLFDGRGVLQKEE